MKWTARPETSGNPLTDAHAVSFDTVADLYDGQDPGVLGTYVARAETVAAKFDAHHRTVLVEALKPFMIDIGSSPASMRQLERLKNDRSVAIVTGQQAGLFTGPMYSLYKALSTIGLAERLERELQRPVVPVFWVASEDHDWAEVNHAYVLGNQEDVRRIDLRTHAEPHQMVCRVALDRTSVEEAVARVADWTPEGQWKSEMLEFLGTSWSPGTSMSTWFARILNRLLGSRGLVVLDPCLPGLRDLVRPVWTTAIREHHEVSTRLDAAYAEVTAAGFTPAVARDEANTTLFYVEAGKRYVLERTGRDTLRARVLDVEKTVDEWMALAEERPTSFSANVLLRPVVQDVLVPTLTYVGGPAEIAYHALSRAVFHAHGRSLPPLALRNRVTIYPPGVVRSMNKWDLTLEDVSHKVDLVTSHMTHWGLGRIHDAFSDHREAAVRRWEAWAKDMADLGPQVGDLARRQVAREMKSISRLESKTERLLLQRNKAEVDQLRGIQRWLWTDGHPQERRLCPLTVWPQYGLDWLSELPIWGQSTRDLAVYHVQL